MSYKRLAVNDAKIGQKVILVNPGSHYFIGTANPVICSRYECCGTVSSVSESRISVKWDNGTRNTYMGNELASAIYRKKALSIRQNGWNIEPTTVKAESGEYISIWLKRIP